MTGRSAYGSRSSYASPAASGPRGRGRRRTAPSIVADQMLEGGTAASPSARNEASALRAVG